MMKKKYPSSNVTLLTMIIVLFLGENVLASTLLHPVQAPSNKTLKNAWGYILIDIQSSAQNATVHIRPTKYKIEKDEWKISSKEWVINASEFTGSPKLIALKEGTYQITSVNYPTYNLPYIVDQSHNAIWRFVVKRQKINYIGTINIEGERGTNTADISISNKAAENREHIQNALSEAIQRYPLVLSFSYRDDFLKELDSKGEPK